MSEYSGEAGFAAHRDTPHFDRYFVQSIAPRLEQVDVTTFAPLPGT